MGSSILACGKAESAVFVLNNARLTTTIPATEFPVGVYQVSGEFKVNTADGSDYAATAWNISVTGPVNLSFVKGISGIPDDGSYAEQSSPGDESAITISRNGGALSVGLIFGSSINSVYKDPTASSPGSYPTSAGALTITSIFLRDQSDTTPASGNVTTGQADFVPMVPSLAVLFPVAALFKAIKRTCQS